MEKIGENVWIKKGNTNVGLIDIDGKRFLIDTGSSEKFAKEVLTDVGNVNFVLHTHSHADHIQGNYLFANRGAKIYANELEIPFIRDSTLEAFYLYGANPPRSLRQNFFKAKTSSVFSFDDLVLPWEIEFVDLCGHSRGMTGVKIQDIIFCGDAYFGSDIIEKYSYPYLVDVNEFLKSLDTLQKMDLRFYIPSHGEPSANPSMDISATRDALMKFIDITLKSIKFPKTVEEICMDMIEKMKFKINSGTFYLFRSFESAILSYLEEKGESLNISFGKWQIK